MSDLNRLVLASQSPRRSELLARNGFKFSVAPSQISEIPDENLNLQEQIRDLALRKAQACLNSGKLMKGQGNLLLGADTVVVLDGQILGKPADRRENIQHLSRLQGRTHSVITGVCLLDQDRGIHVVGHAQTEIVFRSLSLEEIDAYVATGDGLDKAGGYGIQGDAGKFVARVDGPFDNVIGLPVATIEALLAANGWAVERV